MSRRNAGSSAAELSIGTLSGATGVPVDTLRTWERRYGFPSPTSRTGGSHRRYAADTVEAVQLVVRAISLGHRASSVVGLDADELRRLVEAAEPVAPRHPAEPDLDTVRHWLDVAVELDAERLMREFQRELSERPVVEFLECCLGPFITELGRRWQSGAMRVSHEHFAAECVTEFARQRWRPLSEARSRTDAVSVVLATPPTERHCLGLHMAAWVVALGQARVVFLGSDTPMDEVAFAVRQHQARGVVLSVSAAYRGDLQAELRRLRAEVGPELRIAVGGEGGWVRGAVAQRLNGFEELKSWSIQRSRSD